VDHFVVYVAGFFDGEGSVTIARVRTSQYSDYHKIIVALSQRAKYGAVLNRIQETFGGTVLIASEKHRLSDKWSEQAKWQLQDKPGIERFLAAIQPYVIVKARQVELGLEFVRLNSNTGRLRDSLGRIRGRAVVREDIEQREQIRLALREANELGPSKVKPSTLPPLDVQARAPVDMSGNRATVKRGEQHSSARLTDEAVRTIRAENAAGISQSALARRFNVSGMLINGIVRGTRWKHVTDIPQEG